MYIFIYTYIHTCILYKRKNRLRSSLRISGFFPRGLGAEPLGCLLLARGAQEVWQVRNRYATTTEIVLAPLSSYHSCFWYLQGTHFFSASSDSSNTRECQLLLPLLLSLLLLLIIIIRIIITMLPLIIITTIASRLRLLLVRGTQQLDALPQLVLKARGVLLLRGIIIIIVITFNNNNYHHY